MDMESHCGEFRAMGTVISLRSVGVSQATMTRALDVLQAEAARWERIFSRFDAESELSRVNRSNGEPVRVSHDFLDVLDDAIAGFIQSAGRFDPSILDTLELEGYDRTFHSIRPGDERDEPERFRHTDSWKLLDVSLDFKSGTVRLPAGLRIDLGGIAKGAFVDRMMPRFVTWPGALLNAGGDLALVGSPPQRSTWQIGVQHPDRLDEDIAALSLRAGTYSAVATSTTRRRQWKRGDRSVNHLIDPATGRAVDIETPSVTVVANTVTQAEIETKSAIVSAARGDEISPLHASLILLTYPDGTYESITCKAFSSSGMDSGYPTGSAA